MLYQISNATVTAGGRLILSHIDFEIHGTEKIAVVGKNGAGKTTLLKLIAGELTLEPDDKRQGPGILTARRVDVGILNQQPFRDLSRTVAQEFLSSCPCRDPYGMERFEYERECDTLFTGLGFSKEDKVKKLSSFSGGEQTKIALIRLLLQKPDILLLDEPTNHLDLKSVQWLEDYMRRYDKAVVMVSHDRFFLDRVADVVYELAGGRLYRYTGNYTHYREEKLKNLKLQEKKYTRQQEEIARLKELIARFKHKPTKAAFARSRMKMLERMEMVPKPEGSDTAAFSVKIEPAIPGGKWVFEAEHLKIGYEKPLLEISLRIRKGQKMGILGDNGTGKSTFLKTIAGLIPAYHGTYSLGNHITIGYFDQLSARISSDKTVADHFHDLFPSLTEKEARTILGSFLFGGMDAGKRVDSLSGGEKARLVLAELLQSRPNFLILDEPTNHMDIQAKETLESAFQAYTGTILFVSHDRYFLQKIADAVLIFENQTVMYYPFGYTHYLERSQREECGISLPARMKAEEQALVAGIRAVPKAERHRLRELPVEEAYLDWKLRLIREEMETARAQVEALSRRKAQLFCEWTGSEEFWEGQEMGPEKRLECQALLSWLEIARQKWGEACLKWYDTYANLPM